MLPAGSGSASAFKNNEDRWRMIKKMSKDATKCDQEELCQLFGGGFRNEIYFSVISVTWLQVSSSSSVHSDRGPGQGKSMFYQD